MGIIERFCCCCNVRSGSVFCAIYTLVSSAVLVAMLLVRYVGFSYVHNSAVHAVMVYLSMGMYGLLCLFAIVLVLGIHLDRPCLLMPWVVAEVCCMVAATVALCWIDVVQVQREKDLHTWEICIMAFHLINMAVSTYCVFCVFSQMQDLTHGRGTLEWYKLQERRRRRHLATGSFAIMIGHPSMDGIANLGMEPDFIGQNPGRVLSPSTIAAELPPYIEEPPPYTTLPRGHRQSQDNQVSLNLSAVPELLDRAGSPRVVRMRDRTRSPLPAVHRATRAASNSQNPPRRRGSYGRSLSDSSQHVDPPPAYSTMDRRPYQRQQGQSSPPGGATSNPMTDTSPPYTSRIQVGADNYNSCSLPNFP